MNLYGLSDSTGTAGESPAKCHECDATTRLGNGLCLSCTLRQGLDSDREASRESFEAILLQDEVHDTHWRVGNYEILEEIGRGGMGVIYRARQRHSRRIVAVKRIVSYHADSRETLERFRREAEAAASLDHPNILPIYEVGQGEDGLPFFSMKYASGGSLQNAGSALRSDARECVRLMAKIACAVRYAHEHGVLHRDLKPGNILLDAHGEPFVTDFGLAKWLDTGTDLTQTLTIFGTPGYIAPEQAKGSAANLTPAADVYSLGAIAFNLFTGRPPFVGEHALAVVQQASETSAPKLRSLAPELDRDLETICARCLEREPQARYRSAADLATDLERWVEGRPIIARRVSPPARMWRWSKRNPKLAAATAAALCSAMAAGALLVSRNETPHPANLDSPPRQLSAEVKTMTVIPLKVLSADPSEEYLGIGLADALSSQIGRIPEILIRSPSGTRYAKTPASDPLTIGRLLHVEAVLDGTVERVVDNIQVSVRLFRVADAAVIWSQKFDDKFTEIFAIQDAISEGVAKTLIQNVSDEDRKLLTTRHTDSVDAYRAYLKGRYVWNKRTPDALQQSLEFFRRALDLDPTYSSAYAGMADAYALLVWQEQLPRDEFIARAKAAAIKALEIDPSLAEPHATLGYVKFWYDWDFAGAELEFRRAIELNPDYGTAHHWYGEALGMMGRFEDAVRELRLAQQVDPLSPIINADLGKLFFLAREPDQAIEQLRKTLELDPEMPLAHVFLGLAYNKKGMSNNAIPELERVANAPNSRAIFKATLGFVYGQSGRKADARRIISELIQSRTTKQYVSPFHIALVYVGLGENDKAMEWLQTATRERDPFLMYIRVDPNFDSLRGDPRFVELIKELTTPTQRVPTTPHSVAVFPSEAANLHHV